MKKLVLLSALVLSTASVFAGSSLTQAGIAGATKKERLGLLINAITSGNVAQVELLATPDIINEHEANMSNTFSPLGAAKRMAEGRHGADDQSHKTNKPAYDQILNIIKSRGATIVVDTFDDKMREYGERPYAKR